MLARWYGYTLDTIGKMLLTDVWMLDAFLAQHPPADLLIAAYLGYKSPGKAGRIQTMREAVRSNSEAVQALPPRKHLKTLAQMPAHYRPPEMVALIDKMRAEWQQTKNST